MKRMAYFTLGSTLAAAALLVSSGCQSAARSQPAPAATTQSHGASDTLAQSDAQRAQETIEQNQREQSGARRPADPDRHRPVDQPRVGGKR